jgi:CubicO group peptidase (beta-lactamase class C family)
LKGESVQLIHTPCLVLDKEFFSGMRWGLGVVVYGKIDVFPSAISEGSCGWSGTYGTHMWVDYQKELQVVLMINRSNIGGAASYISREVEKLTYELYY